MNDIQNDLVHKINSGRRRLVISLCQAGLGRSECREVEYYKFSSTEEAAEFVRRTKPARGFFLTIPEWQWLNELGTEEVDPYGDSVDRVREEIGL